MPPTIFGVGFDHAATDPSVASSVITGQLATAAALRTRLNDRGGAILGDEVGAGKTFVTFALIADLLLREPGRGVVIFVPNRLLVTKWARQLRDYLMASVDDRERGRALAERIHTMDRGLTRAKHDAIVITTHTVFSYRTSVHDQGACLLAAVEKFPEGRGLRRRSVLKAFGLAEQGTEFRPWWAQKDALTQETLRPLQPLLRRYAQGERGLADEMRQAVHEVRRRVGRRALPDAGLVIIDEAHNLKSASSAVYRSLMSVLDQQFDALLFLTATPFQLGRHELLTIVDFFRAAKRADADPEAFEVHRTALGDAMDRHIEALARFGAAWRDLTVDQAAAFTTHNGDRAPGVATPLVADAGAALRAALTARDTLEGAMRPFVVRTVRERDHEESGGVHARFVVEQSRIPLALVDRLLVEIMRDRRTFVSSALMSACSSWGALFTASIMDAAGRPPSRTRDALLEFRRRALLGDHPKVASTVSAVVDAVHAGEKTLVFVEREQTGEELRARIVAALEAEKAEGLSSDDAQRAALQDRGRLGWPSLRENYLSTVFSAVFERAVRPGDVDARWADSGVQQLWARCDVTGVKRRYDVEKRFWEHVLFTSAVDADSDWRSRVSPPVAECVDRLLKPDYILNGLDLVSGVSQRRLRVRSSAERDDPREPNFRFAYGLVGFRSPWSSCADLMAQLYPDVRADLVDVTANAIATTHLRAEIAEIDAAGDPGAYFREVDALLLDPAGPWPTRFRALVAQIVDAARSSDTELAAERVGAILDALSNQNADRRVVFVKGGTAAATRQHAIDGFNTPLYPEVMIATPVLAEGIDLHRFCRRVIHHDLPWNPAKLEQRTGRVDRVGSLAERLREAKPAERHPIEVGLPFVPGTYDEFIHERVLVRRREFRCLLGNRPEWEGEGKLGEDEAGQPMPEDVVAALQVDLSPDRRGVRPTR